MHTERYIELTEHKDSIFFLPLSSFTGITMLNDETCVCINFNNVNLTLKIKESYREVRNMLLSNCRVVSVNRLWADGEAPELNNIVPFKKP